MAATQSQGIDRIISPPIEDRPTDPDSLMEKPLQVKNDRSSSLIPSVDSGMGLSMNSANQVGSFSPAIDHSAYTPNLCSPQAQAIYYKGSETSGGEWDVYPSYVNAERLDVGSPGIYNENPSVMYHSGYGFSQQMPYGPYSPATTPLPSVGNDAQLYSPQQYSFSGQPYYQQIVPPSMQYVGPPTPVSQPMLNTMVGIDQHVEGMHFGSRPTYPTASFGRGDFSGSPVSPNFNDFHRGFDAFGVGGLWSNWQKPADRQRATAPFSPAVSPQPTSNLGSFGQHIGMPSQQPRSFYGVGSGSDTYNRGYLHTDFAQGSKFGAASVSSMLTNDRSWLAFDYRTQRGKVNSLLCNCNDTLNILNEQNRGPRASKSKSQIANENSPSAEGNNYNSSVSKASDDSYNHLEFLTEYEDAKFFVIKSYTEDNVHKSIKYSIWASTPNGNRKLDAAYLEAKDKLSPCPVFLLFSVNASAQFCGVAEMVGPVDFEKSVDYWQQDKWSGQFPVKWHIIKDVPNSQFRHIVLENNESKPVTNSRDTQEVKLDQGIEMLKIFKNYESDVSILDDFEFYEDRQKAMQERKARQQQSSLVGIGVAEGNEDRNFVSVPNNFIKQMSKSFAEVVRVDDSIKEVSAAERGGVESDGSLNNNRVKVEEASSVVSQTQTN